MRIAILGASSQIAKDLIQSFSVHNTHALALFARRPQAVVQWLADVGLQGRYPVADFDQLADCAPFDAIINFVGVGNPATALSMGASIFDATYQYDQLALEYLQEHQACRYIFLSSGAAFGASFSSPVSLETPATIPLNSLAPQDWYGVAKLHAECRHRALSRFAITDLRVFNYFSRSQDISARFLISDILRAIREGAVLQTSSDPIVRDFLHPSDFHQLVEKVLAGPAGNLALDCYSAAATSKDALLKCMAEQFGLRYEVVGSAGVNATGSKANYYSTNHRAHGLGYVPAYTSLEGVVKEAGAILRR